MWSGQYKFSRAVWGGHRWHKKRSYRTEHCLLVLRNSFGEKALEDFRRRGLLMQSPPDHPGRHSAQKLPLTKKSSLGPHVPLLQRLQFSNTLQPERKWAETELQWRSRRTTRQRTQTHKYVVCQSWGLVAQLQQTPCHVSFHSTLLNSSHAGAQHTAASWNRNVAKISWRRTLAKESAQPVGI